MPERSSSGTSDYLAAERTFLAWIRTGLALMGFGFVVARFGLFLEALQTGHLSSQVRAYGLSFWFGTGLIVLGVMVNLFSAWSHIRLVHELERGGPAVPRPSTLAVAVALILAVLGLAMAVYLIWVRDPVPAHLQTSEEKSMSPKSENGVMASLSPITGAKMSGECPPSGVIKLHAWMAD
jgi:putative membrane protein